MDNNILRHFRIWFLVSGGLFGLLLFLYLINNPRETITTRGVVEVAVGVGGLAWFGGTLSLLYTLIRRAIPVRSGGRSVFLGMVLGLVVGFCGSLIFGFVFMTPFQYTWILFPIMYGVVGLFAGALCEFISAIDPPGEERGRFGGGKLRAPKRSFPENDLRLVRRGVTVANPEDRGGM